MQQLKMRGLISLLGGLALLAFGCSPTDPPEGVGGDGGVRSNELCTEDTEGDCEPCIFDVECGSTQTCRSGRCVQSIPCDSAESCPSAAPACSPEGACGECATTPDCKSDTVCIGSECVARCEGDTDCPKYSVCDPVTQACVQCSDDSDCPASLTCRKFRCEPDSCTPGESRCDHAQNAMWTCNPSGSLEVPFFCPAGKHCLESAQGVATCSPHVCVPSGAVCKDDGVTLTTCSDDGLSKVDIDCNKAGDGGLCVDGTCKTTLCQPGEKKCLSAHSLFECSSRGLEWAPVDTCELGDYCDTKTLACVPEKCVPGATLCDENTLKTCADDGSGPLPGGEDCGKDEGLCVNRACKPVLCSGEYVCTDNNVYRCSQQGTKLTLWEECGSFEFCREGVSTCQASVCNPGQSYCDGNTIKKCDAVGSGLEDGGTACGSQVCLNAQCLDLICDPFQVFCSGNSVYECDFSGTAATLIDACGSSEHCAAGQRSCQANVCVPNTQFCSGNSIATCNGDGSATVGTAEPCGTGQSCSDGQCKDQICSGFHCESGNVHSCSADGLVSSVYDVCAANEYCQEGTSACLPDQCAPQGEPTCVGNSRTNCAADGSGYTSALVDCGSEICVGGVCKPQICTPYTYSCQSDGRYFCPGPGVEWVLDLLCEGGRICGIDPGAGFGCWFPSCTPGDLLCGTGGVLLECEEPGVGYFDHGARCAPGLSCLEGTGTCVPVICQPGEQVCTSLTSNRYCDQYGTAWNPWECGPGEVCSSESGACGPPICLAGQPSCKGETPATCNASESGYVNAGAACSSSQVCTRTGCSTEAIDGPVGPGTADPSPKSEISYITYQVDKPRLLRSASAYIGESGLLSVSWAVYRHPTRESLGQRIYYQFERVMVTAEGFVQVVFDTPVILEPQGIYSFGISGAYYRAGVNAVTGPLEQASFGRPIGSFRFSGSGADSIPMSVVQPTQPAIRVVTTRAP